jgi:AcrR family transcriptional regulator
VSRKKGDGSREDVMRAVLDAAKIEFTTQGYAATTLDLVAERAGFSKGAVYSSFSSKLDLFTRVLHDRTTMDLPVSMAAITAPVDDSGAFPDIDTIAERLAQYSLDNERWHLLAYDYALIATRDEDVAKLYRKTRPFVKALGRGVITSYLANIGSPVDPATVDLLATLSSEVILSMALEGTVDPATYTLEYRTAMFKLLFSSVLAVVGGEGAALTDGGE